MKCFQISDVEMVVGLHRPFGDPDMGLREGFRESMNPWGHLSKGMSDLQPNSDSEDLTSQSRWERLGKCHVRLYFCVP